MYVLYTNLSSLLCINDRQFGSNSAGLETTVVLFLERRQYMPSFKLIKLTARVTGAGEPDL
jgi:hypothetical protein